MSVVAEQTGFTDAAFESLISARPSPDWLRQLRRDFWQAYSAAALPSPKEEEWMRTDIRTFRLDRFGLPAEPNSEQIAAVPAGLLTTGVDLGGSFATLDSHVVRADLSADLAKQGVLFGSLESLAAEHPDLIRRHLYQAVNGRADKFALLHAAAWQGGTVLYVPRGVCLDRPLHIINALTAGSTDLSHTLVILDDDAEATLLAETASVGEPGAALHCGAIELILARNARLRYVNLQNWSNQVWHFAHQKALVGADASLQWTIAALGSRLAKVNQHVGLVGEGANCQVNGVMFTEGKQHLSYNTLQHHVAPHCRSDLLYKGALQDASRVVWRGMIKVDQGAQKTDGYQRNDNLMLSEAARSDSIPGLEIEADDVRCTHGSTAGRVDEEQIFYARCRGLTRKEAVRLIVTGFFQQVFDRITIESVRDALGGAIRRRVRDYS